VDCSRSATSMGRSENISLFAIRGRIDLCGQQSTRSRLILRSDLQPDSANDPATNAAVNLAYVFVEKDALDISRLEDAAGEERFVGV